MLSLAELRYLCVEAMKSRPTLSMLILTAIKYNKKELDALFYFAGYSLQKFKEGLRDNEEMGKIEDKGLIDIIRTESNPNILHLIKWCCLNNEGVKSKLIKDGLIIEDFIGYLDTKIHLADTRTILPDKTVSNNPLFHISGERSN
ncbi:MAG: hypothetical protein HUU54_05545 [Ignavibacteriaceae bacterium]|nr:hypothetical protein [Ignavibacteriaceae bacterium]